MTTNFSTSAHRCFCCGDVTEQPLEQAVRRGWSFQPVRDIAACPTHTIHTHDVNIARIVAQHGLTLDEFYRTLLPVSAEHRQR